MRGVCKGQSGTTAGRGAGAEGQKEYPATGRGSGNNNPAASDVKAIAHDLLPTNAQSDGGAVGIVLLSNTFRQATGARRSGARAAASFGGLQVFDHELQAGLAVVFVGVQAVDDVDLFRHGLRVVEADGVQRLRLARGNQLQFEVAVF